MKDLKNVWETEIGKIIKDLSKIALADGTITNDERQLLEIVNQDVKKFVKAYIKALNDHKITEKETYQLEALWSKFYTNAEETANQDGVITSDEKTLLLRIAESVLPK